VATNAEETVSKADFDEVTAKNEELVKKLDLENLDLIMVEGFKHLPFEKIELHRPSTGNSLIFTEDDSVIAIASDEDLETGGLPLLNINAPEEVAGFINRWLDKRREIEVKSSTGSK
jgi:molybdopterin-guanine dinucleotide biosynthesis protein MobB